MPAQKMSAAEAIQLLKLLCGKMALKDKWFDAVKRAIEALEKEI